MLIENPVYRAQIKNALQKNRLNMDMLSHTSILITGASGMIGSALVDFLLFINEEYKSEIQIYALGRTKEKLELRFRSSLCKGFLHIVEADISKPYELTEHVDYIIHGASNADPVMMAKFPVDTLLANVIGINTVLNIGKATNCKRILYISSGEMYGQADATQSQGFVENYSGFVDYSSPRSCYPSGKRAAEVLCQSYRVQYDVDAVIVRPCHCYGPTMTESDSRAVSQFFRSIINNQYILLKSATALERSHCHVIDAASAILCVLTNGTAGNAYNIANPESQVTVQYFAERVAYWGKQSVHFASPNTNERLGFSPVKRAVLNSDKLKDLHWIPTINLDEGIRSTLDILRDVCR